MMWVSVKSIIGKKSEYSALILCGSSGNAAKHTNTAVQDDEDGNMPQLLGHVPLYLLGTEQAQQACRIVLEMYRDASPPQAARGRALVATMSQYASPPPFRAFHCRPQSMHVVHKLLSDMHQNVVAVAGTHQQDTHMM